MTSVEEALVDSIAAAFHRFRTGKVPPPIAIPEDQPDNEVRQLITYVNRFLAEFAPFAEAMEEIARGELQTRAVLGRMAVAQSLKALQSNLPHLTWKTQQIAAGDLEQRVDFMGDFSLAFNRMTQQLRDSYQELGRRNQFIRRVFGRYTSDQVVEALLDAPDGLRLGGEKREITILMSNLRGFTALSERLEATEVVSLLNQYLAAMVEVIQRHGGTVDAIIGDAILVPFGAPLAMEEASYHAVLCSLEMQQAMAGVNEQNVRRGWPEIEMGIGLHRGEVVVGSIGSAKRSHYTVIGRTVNTTARIESFTAGGQVIVSPTVIEAAGRGLIFGGEVEVRAKGMKEALRCRQLLGHQDHPELGLEAEAVCTALAEPLAFHYVLLNGKHFTEPTEHASLLALSRRWAVIEAVGPLPLRYNLLLRLDAASGEEEVPELFAKVIRSLDESSHRYSIQFTSVAPGIIARLDRLARRSP